MGQTISEKIIARAAERRVVSPREFVEIEPDIGPVMYAYGSNDPTKFLERTIIDLGADKMFKPEKFVIFFDHNQPAKTIEDASLFKSVKEGVRRLGIRHFYAMRGVGHSLMAELGLARPGMLLVHGDPHSSTLGGAGVYATNGGKYGGTPIEVLATGRLTMRVPETIECRVNNRLMKGVMSRDVWQHVIGELGPDGALGKVMEFSGSAVEEMSLDGRMALCNPVVFAGAETGIVNPDDKILNYFIERTDEPIRAVKSDPDAEYSEKLVYDASEIEPMVAHPPNVYSSKTVAEVEGKEIDQAVLGTCAGGRMEDLKAAADILLGRKVHSRVRMLVVPTTQGVYLEAVRSGVLEALAEAGAIICAPTCDICWGRLGLLAAGETSISQQTLNTPGRSGSFEAEIFLASAATIAASAVKGEITDPRSLL